MTFIKCIESKIEPLSCGYIFQNISNDIWLCKFSSGRVATVLVDMDTLKAVEVKLNKRGVYYA